MDRTLGPRHFQLNYDRATGRFVGHHEDHPLDLFPHEVRMMAAGLRGALADNRRMGQPTMIRAYLRSGSGRIMFDMPIEQASRMLEYVELLIDQFDAQMGNEGPPDRE